MLSLSAQSAMAMLGFILPLLAVRQFQRKTHIDSNANYIAQASRLGSAAAHIWNIPPNFYCFSYSRGRKLAVPSRVNAFVSVAGAFYPATEQIGPRRAYICSSNPRYLSDQKFIVT